MAPVIGRAERGQDHQPAVAILFDPMLSDPIRQGGEAEPDAEENEQVGLREVVLENGHAGSHEEGCPDGTSESHSS
jgi:hypothetical protein